MKIFKELWDYRTMISNLVKKDMNARYKGSVLGFLWTFINPLFQLIIYTVLFGIILPQGIENFAMFLFVALVPWLFCATSLAAGAQCIMSSAGLVQKIYFPRMVLPIVTVTSNFINLLLSFIIVFIMLLATGVGINPSVIWLLPVVMIVEYIFVLGLVFIFSALTVFFRDLEHILGIVTMGWMYLTPILYSIDLLPAKLQSIMYYNPMSGIVMSFRNILFYKTMPDFKMLAYSALIAVILVIVGTLIFQKLQKRFAEEL